MALKFKTKLARLKAPRDEIDAEIAALVKAERARMKAQLDELPEVADESAGDGQQ